MAQTNFDAVLGGTPTVESVGLCQAMVNINRENFPEKLLKFIFAKTGNTYVNLPKIFDMILTTKYCKYDENSINTDEYKTAHNYCHLFMITDKMGPPASENEYIAFRMKSFVEKEPLEKNEIICSHFSTIFKSLLNWTKGEYLDHHPYFLFPLLNHPDHIGFMSNIFSVLMLCPKFYTLVAEKAAEFANYAKNPKYKEFNCQNKSYVLLNTFNSLFGAAKFQKDDLKVEAVKCVLDAVFNCKDSAKIVFYEGILFLSRVLPYYDNKHVISRYVKVRGKGFYKREGLYEMEIDANGEISEKLKLFIDTFSIFFAAGIDKLYPLFFRMDRPVSSDFNRTFLDYITKMSDAKFNRFIENNKIPELIMKSIPPFPTDKEVMEAEENIQYLNPHVILLAIYIFEGLPRRESLPVPPDFDEESLKKIVKNERFIKSVDNKVFSDFMVDKILPYKQLLFDIGW